MKILIPLLASLTASAIDDLDLKTAKEILAQEVNCPVGYYDSEFFSKETREIFNHIRHEGSLPDKLDKIIKQSISVDINKLYKNKIVHDFCFNPSKFSSSYRNNSNENIDYVYFYLLIGILDNYKIEIPDLDTSDFVCKKGEYFKNYKFDDRSTHYSYERTDSKISISNKIVKNERLSNSKTRTALGTTSPTDKDNSEVDENVNIDEYKENDQDIDVKITPDIKPKINTYSEKTKQAVNIYIEDCFKNYENFKNAIAYPANFEQQLCNELNSYFKNNDAPLVPMVKNYSLEQGFWKSMFKNHDTRQFSVYYSEINNSDVLKYIVEQDLADAEDIIKIQKQNKIMALYLLDVLKKNKKSFTTPKSYKNGYDMDRRGTLSLSPEKNKEIALERKRLQKRYKQYIEVLSKIK